MRIECNAESESAVEFGRRRRLASKFRSTIFFVLLESLKCVSAFCEILDGCSGVMV